MGFHDGSGKSRMGSSVLKPPQFSHLSGHLSGTNFSKEWKLDGIECGTKRRWGRRDTQCRHSLKITGCEAKTTVLGNPAQRTRESGRAEKGLDPISSDSSLPEHSSQRHKAVAQPESPVHRHVSENPNTHRNSDKPHSLMAKLNQSNSSWKDKCNQSCISCTHPPSLYTDIYWHVTMS